MLLIICICRKISGSMRLNILFLYTGRCQSPFSKKMAAAASFSFKIGGSNQYLVTLLAVILTWSGYWMYRNT